MTTAAVRVPVLFALFSFSLVALDACSSSKSVGGKDGAAGSGGSVGSGGAGGASDASTDGGTLAGTGGSAALIPCVDGGAGVVLGTTVAPARPVAVAIDDARVYFTTQSGGDATPGLASAVMAVPLAGGTPMLIASGQSSPPFNQAEKVVVVGTTLYFVAEGLWTVPAAGGTAVKLDASRQSLVASGGSAYFADYGFTASLKSITPPSTTPTVLTSNFHGYDLAFNGASFFWQDGRDGMPDNVTTMPLGGAASIVANNAGNRGNYSVIVADATTVFWGATTPDQFGGIRSAPVGGGSPTFIASHLDSFAEALAIDDGNVYILTSHFLYKLSKAGGPLVCLSATNIYIGGSSLAVDATSVYWPDQATARIMKVAK